MRVSGRAVFAACLAASCGTGGVTDVEPPIRHAAVQPADGTVVRRGQRVAVRVRVTDGPPQISCSLAMDVDYVHPDGRADRSYLPNSEIAHGAAPYPIDLAIGFQVPIGTPFWNPFISPGSVVTAVRPRLDCNVGVEDRGPGMLARYPVTE